MIYSNSRAAWKLLLFLIDMLLMCKVDKDRKVTGFQETLLGEQVFPPKKVSIKKLSTEDLYDFDVEITQKPSPPKE